MCHTSIGKGTGYRNSELSGLVEGSTLVVGGKEIEVTRYCCLMVMSSNCHAFHKINIEYFRLISVSLKVMSKISESEWQSGRCFHAVSSDTTVATTTSIPGMVSV